MKEREIIYGAWLMFFNKPVQIDGIQKGQLHSKYTGWVEISQFKGIRITGEMLTRNGYRIAEQKKNGFIFRKGKTNELDILYAQWGKGEADFRLQKGSGPCLYVHELQAAFSLSRRKKFEDMVFTFKV